MSKLYLFTLLLLESNLPKSVMSRSDIAEELNVNDSLISPQMYVSLNSIQAAEWVHGLMDSHCATTDI